MALDRRSTLTVVGEQACAADDALRQMLTTLIQDVLERELVQELGAHRFERTAERTGWAERPSYAPVGDARRSVHVADCARPGRPLSAVPLRPLPAE